MANITFVDVTLRDGNHTYRHQFTPEIIRNTAAALDAAGVDMIEVGHGDGIGGSSLHVGRAAATDRELLEAACGAVKNAKVAVFFAPGLGNFSDLEMAAEVGVKVVRMATHATEADITEQHIRRAKAMGLYICGYLVSAGMASPEKLAEEARKMESYGADYINLAESQGHLVPSEVAARVAAVRRAVNIPIGFHPHNNLGLAIGNILAAIGEGASFVDGSLKGFGGGAGNAQTEVAVAALLRAGHTLKTDLFKIMDAAAVFKAQVGSYPMPVIENDSILMGYANVYGGYLHPVQEAAKKYGVDPRALVLRLGARKVVAAQEDIVVEEAQRLAAVSPV
ncbi:4-hydroxy-2-oxovalerate aldolase [Limnohabitans sp.]|jgi:4-hydroxy 2-oxovalerate aldolase|uniref:4-hydroxy-2-oxovalerate aldolase n=1 Tax=Limnohabitans sp. TaxID=1907725 RepID=UPI00260C727E|nr:4-hydroxy-2-oxovalerate aldolase [Limnohabitans sp.]